MMNASSMAGPQEILWPQFTGRGARSYRVCRIGIVSEIEATEERVTQHADCTWSRQKDPQTGQIHGRRAEFGLVPQAVMIHPIES